MQVLVTGGAGFIGSHLVEALLGKDHTVIVLDDLSSGRRSNLADISASGNFKMITGDCRVPEDVRRAIRDVDAIFHFAGNPEVRLDVASPRRCFEQNVETTFVLLEEVSKSSLQEIIFASTSTIYGDANVLPTPEDYGPLKPISVYGAAKLACEAMVSSFCHSFGKRGVIVRMANIVGPRSTHGVIFDFVGKLMKDPTSLEVLGDGAQAKSYLYIDDCVRAIISLFNAVNDTVSVYNVGSEDTVRTLEIAEIVKEEMNLPSADIYFSNSVESGRGWVGDVRQMQLDVTKLKSHGWKPRFNSSEAVREAVRTLVKETQTFPMVYH